MSIMTVYVVKFSFKKIPKIAIVTAVDHAQAWLSIVKKYGIYKKYLKLNVALPYYADINNGILEIEL